MNLNLKLLCGHDTSSNDILKCKQECNGMKTYKIEQCTIEGKYKCKTSQKWWKTNF